MPIPADSIPLVSPGDATVAEVVVPLPLPYRYHYEIPDDLRAKAHPGMRVHVPFGRRTTVGYLVACVTRPTDIPVLKPIKAVLDSEPLWQDGDLTFFQWTADYYQASLGEVIKTALPAGNRLEVSTQSNGDGPVRLQAGQRIKYERFFEAIPSDLPRRGRAETLHTFLIQEKGASAGDLRRRFGECNALLKRLCDRGDVVLSQREVYRDPFLGAPPPPDQPRQLKTHQADAVCSLTLAIDAQEFRPFLLHGVTGSGKTEVYLHAIDHALQKGLGALVLVPEIALTPQLVSRFRSRFPSEGLAILHSGMSDGERFDAWRRIYRQECPIVIGARSAIFAPLPRIGIIVVDEEHESSFKQGDGVRYNARDLALVRALQHKAVVVLGSATPSIASKFAADAGRLHYLSLPQRVAMRPMPTCTVVPTSITAERSISPVLAEALLTTYAKGEQSLIFLNRRGFSSCLVCPTCGKELRCPNCSVTLTHHRQRRKNLCHYCEYQIPSPTICPHCGDPDLREVGVGTERLEEELQELLPQARIARMDSDTTAGKHGHQRILDRMARQEIDILVGTQMIAKGHDFPGVTLVGVVQGEGSLYLPDYRASERTYQLLSQVIGRAGRGELPGQVVVQTTDPEHYAIHFAVEHDYEGFYQQELQFREELGYPPAGYLAALKISATSEGTLAREVQLIAELLRDIKQKIGLRTEILGPAQAPLYRLQGRFRYQILLKDRSRPRLHQLIKAYRQERVPKAGIRERVDIDPLDLL